MKPVVIVGANRIGLELAERINNSVLVEADPAKYTMLRRENPDLRIVGGDGARAEVLARANAADASAIVTVTGKDYVNHKVALAAGEFSVPKIVAILNDEGYRHRLTGAGVTHVISPSWETIDAIMEEVYPSKEVVTDIVVTVESPIHGKLLRDIQLPENTVIAAVVKGESLLKPTPELSLESGDVVTLISLGEMDVELFEILAGGFDPFIPRKKIVFLLHSPQDMAALREIARLAAALDVPVELFVEAGEDKLRSAASLELEKHGLAPTFIQSEGNVLARFVEYLAVLGHESGILAALHQERVGHFGHLLPLRLIKELLRKTHVPLLFARGREYERILHLLDSSMIGERCTKCAAGLAIQTSTNLYALCPHSSGSTEHDIVKAHTKRMARIYDISVIEGIVEGNPHIEYIQKVREQPSQLVVLNWDPPTVRRDILARIINDGEASVLVLEREPKV